MLISCKCLNFIATSAQQQYQQQQRVSNAAVANAAADAASPVPAPPLSPGASDIGNNKNNATALLQAFLQKYPRNFIFYSQCMDFFKQTLGPVSDLTINAINQRNLIYSLTLEVAALPAAATGGTPTTPTTPNLPNLPYLQSWQLSFCINCNSALCAKQLQANGGPAHYLINSALLTSSEELTQRRADKSYSEILGLLIMDHPQLEQSHQQPNGGLGGVSASASSFSIGSLNAQAQLLLDNKQQRLRQLQAQQQARLKREIAETDERIQRYTEQQFALLKSFREKSDQEYALLICLIQQVPEQAGELLDRTLPALEVNGGAINSYTATVAAVARRRNTLTGRRESNGAATLVAAAAATALAGHTLPTTPTALGAQMPPNFLALPGQTATAAVNNGNGNSSGSNNNAASAIVATATAAGPTLHMPTTVITSGITRKLTSFDTPPATPEATPMSVGNSPTFRQQQQQQQQQQLPLLRFGGMPATATFQQQFPTPSADVGDDCLFDLEDIDVQMPLHNNNNSSNNNNNSNYQQRTTMLHHPPQYFRHMSVQQSQHENNMSDLDESDAAEEAEDALDLDSSMPISMHRPGAGQRATPAEILNFAKSLPIEIANSPLAERSAPYVSNNVDDDLDNTVDIAASIKALAKSVHGEAVFGDLPRPRLRSQI